GIRGLPGSEKNPGILKGTHRLRGRGHVGAFANRKNAVSDQGAGISSGQLVLGCRRHGDLARHVPYGTVLDVQCPAPFQPGVLGDARAPRFLYFLNEVQVYALFVDDVAARVRTGNDPASEFDDLLHGIDGDVPRPGNHHSLACEIRAVRAQHPVDEIGGAVSRRFLARTRASMDQRLPGQHAGLIAIGQPLELTEHISDLTAADANVTGRNVGIFTQMAVEFRHERLAKAHDLPIGSAPWVEIGTSFATSYRQTGQGVLESLLETQELDDSEIHGRMKAQASLVRPQCGIELHPEAARDVDFALVVYPGNAEDDLALGLAKPFDQRMLCIFRMLGDHSTDALENFDYGLVELGFAGVPLQYLCKNGFQFLVDIHQVHLLIVPPDATPRHDHRSLLKQHESRDDREQGYGIQAGAIEQPRRLTAVECAHQADRGE